MKGQRHFVWFMGLIIAMAIGQGTATAQVIVDDPSLPPAEGVYRTPADVHAEYPTPPFPDWILDNILHGFFFDINRVPVGADEIESFESTALGDVSGGVIPVGSAPVELTGPVQVIVFGKVGNTTGTFQTEILSMDLTGNTPLGPIAIRESPTQQSTGETTITDLGGGQFLIDSFFDVYTELSLGGDIFASNGVSWTPARDSVRVTLTAIPLPAALWIALPLLGGLVVGKVRRKR